HQNDVGCRMCSSVKIIGMPRRVDTVDPDEDFTGAEPARLDSIDDLMARGLLGIRRNRILKIENHAIGRQRPCFIQRPSMGPGHVQHPAPWADGYCRLQLGSTRSLASAPRPRHSCDGLPEPVTA